MDAKICGFSIPFRIEPDTGSVATVAGIEKIKENIKHILLTGVGERVMRRDYGGGIRKLVNDPNSDVLKAIVQHQAAKTIGQHEPRVLLQNVHVSTDRETLWVEIQYVVRKTQKPQSMSVPIGLGGI